MLYLPAFSQRKFATFEQKNIYFKLYGAPFLVEYNQTIQRGSTFFFKGGRIWSFPEKPGRHFRQKVRETSETQNLTPFEAVDKKKRCER